jgi:5-methyltetrahydropteroyltriglutamate--homocysteine methyltransferase
MSQSTDRILTTHVGSLIRPPDLLALIEARQEGKPITDAAFAEALRRSVAEVVRQQADAGVDIVSDGEFGKTGSWSRYVVERLGGIRFRPDAVASISSIRGKDFRDFDRTRWGLGDHWADHLHRARADQSRHRESQGRH